MTQDAKLIFFCGKMAAGKSTLARDLAEQEGAILLIQDQFLAQLFSAGDWTEGKEDGSKSKAETAVRLMKRNKSLTL